MKVRGCALGLVCREVVEESEYLLVGDFIEPLNIFTLSTPPLRLQTRTHDTPFPNQIDSLVIQS